MSEQVHALWERLSLYLPVMLMGILALGTYWLVRSTPMLVVPRTETASRHEPDYFMHKFSVKTFDEVGRLKSEVIGAAARHFPDSDTLEIDTVRIRSFGEGGRQTVATAKRAVAKGDASVVELFGEARVAREPYIDQAGRLSPASEFRGEFLHVFLNAERVKSHRPVDLISGNNRFTADALDFDNREGVIELKGRVRGTVQPGRGSW